MRETAPTEAPGHEPSSRQPLAPPPASVTTGRWWLRAAASLGVFGPAILNLAALAAVVAACRGLALSTGGVVFVAAAGVVLHGLGCLALWSWTRGVGGLHNAVRAWGVGDTTTARLWLKHLRGQDAAAWSEALCNIETAASSAVDAATGPHPGDAPPTPAPSDEAVMSPQAAAMSHLPADARAA